jgi:hypothetical protein
MDLLSETGGSTRTSIGVSVARIPHGVKYTAAATHKPKAVMDAPTSANRLHAGASLAVSHQPPTAITPSRTVPARTGASTLPEPCEAK